MIKVIAFDVWQTLADYPFNLYEKVLEISKLPMTLREFILKKTEIEVSQNSDDKSRFLEKMKVMGVKDKNILSKIENLYSEAHDSIFIYEDVIETLNYLKNKGFILVLITNVDRYAHEKVISLFPKDMFDTVIASYDVGFKKPNKDIFLKLSDKYGLDGNSIMMVGDSEDADILPSKKLGWKTVFINRLGKKCKFADYNISSLRELKIIF